jgi:hypothetical protein
LRSVNGYFLRLIIQISTLKMVGTMKGQGL